MHLTGEQVSFLSRLGKTPDGQHLLMLIQAEIAECNGRLRTLSGDDLLREQGRARCFDELVKNLTRTTQSAPMKQIRIPADLST